MFAVHQREADNGAQCCECDYVHFSSPAAIAFSYSYETMGLSIRKTATESHCSCSVLANSRSLAERAVLYFRLKRKFAILAPMKSARVTGRRAPMKSARV